MIFHADQGGEYTGEMFADACRNAGVTQSMGRTGSALDNAVAESFNSTLEWELLRNNHFQTRGQARHAVAGWIDDYNSRAGIPPTGCSAPSPTNTHAPNDTARNRPAATRGGGMNHNGGGFAAADIPVERRAGYGAVPPASRVAAAIAARRA